jgi:imidazolonepropionase
LGVRRGSALDELGIITDGAVLIRDGVLMEVGTSRRVENLAEARDAFEINAAGRVVMPGFVDSHTHLVFPTPEISHQELENASREVRTGTAKRLAGRTRHHLHSMARHGTTTVEAKTGCGPDDRAEIKLMRVLAGFKKEPVDVVPTLLMRFPEMAGEEETTADAVADWYCRALLPKIRQRKLARFADVAWDSDPRIHFGFQNYLDSARTLGLGRKVHADRGGSAAAITMAVKNFAVSVDHLEQATPDDVALLAGSDTIATLLPYPSFHRHDTPPARQLIEAGIPVALASDFNPRHTPNLNMQTVVALACLQMKLTPAEAISAATINGAHALGCADQTGSLEPGKSADVLVLNTPDYREVATHFGMNLVHLAVKRGELIYKEGPVAKRSFEELSLEDGFRF